MHQLCVLLGYGADAICPYLVYESIGLVIALGLLEDPMTEEEIFENYMAACARGISKVMAKMGISTLQSYKVGQMFIIIILLSMPVPATKVSNAT